MAKIPTKYRKGLGIPYQGSKRDIAFSIVCAIYQRHPQAEYFYDLFGGGGAITAVAVQFGYKVIYNEKNTAVYNLFKRLCDKTPLPREWYKWVSREQFKACLGKTDTYSAMVQSVWSFGNNGTGYLFGEELETKKRLMHEVVVNKDISALEELQKILQIKLKMPVGKSINKRRLNLLQQVKIHISENIRREQQQELERLQGLQQLTQLENLSRLTQLENLSYEQVPIDTPRDKTVIYCDPPYRDTNGYTAGAFDNAKLDEWFKACEYPCYMSEYRAQHECVLKLSKRALFCAEARKKKPLVEKLYWNGK